MTRYDLPGDIYPRTRPRPLRSACAIQRCTACPRASHAQRAAGFLAELPRLHAISSCIHSPHTDKHCGIHSLRPSRMVYLIVGFETQRGNTELKASPPRPLKQRSLLSEMLHHDYVSHGPTEESQYSYSDDDCSSCYLDEEEPYSSSLEDSADGLGSAAAQQQQQLYSTSSEPIPVPNSRLRNQHLWQRARWELQQQAHRQYQYEAVKLQHPVAPARVQQPQR